MGYVLRILGQNPTEDDIVAMVMKVCVGHPLEAFQKIADKENRISHLTKRGYCDIFRSSGSGICVTTRSFQIFPTSDFSAN